VALGSVSMFVSPWVGASHLSGWDRCSGWRDGSGYDDDDNNNNNNDNNNNNNDNNHTNSSTIVLHVSSPETRCVSRPPPE
jgi:hypothetical protein